MKRRTENIFQVVDIATKPSQVYKALLSEEKTAAFTKMDASITPVEGGAFTTCNGRNHGYHVKLIKDQRIVMAWSHQKFPDNYFSIVDIELEKIDGGTRLHFNQLGVPEECDGWLTEGWNKVYWKPLQDFFSISVRKKSVA